MENVKSNKTVRFYSKQEKAALKPFITGKEKISETNLADFCKKYNRNYFSVRSMIYTARTRQLDQKIARKAASKKTRTVRTVQKTVNNKLNLLKKNEFVIPVKNWEIQATKDGANLVLKF